MSEAPGTARTLIPPRNAPIVPWQSHEQRTTCTSLLTRWIQQQDRLQYYSSPQVPRVKTADVVVGAKPRREQVHVPLLLRGRHVRREHVGPRPLEHGASLAQRNYRRFDGVYRWAWWRELSLGLPVVCVGDWLLGCCMTQRQPQATRGAVVYMHGSARG